MGASRQHKMFEKHEFARIGLPFGIDVCLTSLGYSQNFVIITATTQSLPAATLPSMFIQRSKLLLLARHRHPPEQTGEAPEQLSPYG